MTAPLMDTLRILIADHHYLVRLGLRSLIGSHTGWEVCGEAVDGREAVEMCKQLHPDLLILDIGMPKLNGVDAARQILRADPSQKILVITDVDSEIVIGECLEAGVRGWAWKSDGGPDLILAIEELQNRGTFFTPRVAELILKGYLQKSHSHPEETSVGGLSLREREVVQLLSEGNMAREVASILRVSVKTAETHRSNIMRKLGIHSVTELVLYAVRNNIIRVPLAVSAQEDGKSDGHGARLPSQEDRQLFN